MCEPLPVVAQTSFVELSVALFSVVDEAAQLELARQAGRQCQQRGESISALIAMFAGMRNWLVSQYSGPPTGPSAKTPVAIDAQLFAWLAAACDAFVASAIEPLVARAQSDSLTQLYNRAMLDEQLEAELQRARRYGRAVTLMMLDINGFKQVNDRFGHLAGDAVLRQLAQVLRASLRKNDAAFRYGGDEFALLLPETSLAQSVHVLQRVEQQLRQQTAAHPLVIPWTFSWGVAAFPDDASDVVTLISRADERLYAQKRAAQPDSHLLE